MPLPISMLAVRYLVIGVSAAVLAACAAPRVPTTGADGGASPKQLRDRQILVTLRDDPQWDTVAESLRQEYGLQKSGAFPLKSIGVQCLAFIVPATLDIGVTVDRLRRDRRVDHVQLNRAFDNLGRGYNDRYASMQHGMKKMRAAEVHALSTGAGVRVTVIDTGIDVNHADLAGRITRTENFVDGGEASFNADAHGTAVAGIIGAQANNGIGVFGVAPRAEIRGYKACWYPAPGSARARCSTWTLARAIDRAILERTHIVNLSLSGPEDKLLARLIRRAAAQDIAVVAAIDEARPDSGFPANLDDVIAAISDAGTTSLRAPATGLRSVVAAPGTDILTAMPNDRYDFVSGSSMAAAHVTGVIALLRGRDPKLAVADIRKLLLPTAQTPSTSSVDACDVFARLLARPVCDEQTRR